MSAKVISGRMDIGDVWVHIEDAITGDVRIDPSAYRRLTYNYAGGASDNWDEVAAAIDLVNLRRNQSATATLGNVLEFLQKKIADRRFMQKEFGSWIYTDLHFEPTVVQYAELRKRGNLELAAGLRAWLRALGGYLAWAGCWGPGKTWAKAVSKGGPGARLLVGRGAYNPRTDGVPHSVFTGKRSWHFEGDWTQSIFAPVLLSSLCFGIRPKRGDLWKSHNRFLDTIEATYGPLGIFTPAEQLRLLDATKNDIAALEWCRTKLIGDWLPAEKNTFIRTEHGVGQVLHEAKKTATAPTYYSGWDDDGTTYAAGADNGGRGGRGEQIEDGRADFDLATRTGWCQRTTGPDRVRVDFPLPVGDLVAVLTAQHSKGSAVTYYRNGVAISGPPAPTSPQQPGTIAPKPGKKRKRWWEFWK